MSQADDQSMARRYSMARFSGVTVRSSGGADITHLAKDLYEEGILLGLREGRQSKVISEARGGGTFEDACVILESELSRRFFCSAKGGCACTGYCTEQPKTIAAWLRSMRKEA